MCKTFVFLQKVTGGSVLSEDIISHLQDLKEPVIPSVTSNNIPQTKTSVGFSSVEGFAYNFGCY